MPQNIYSIYDLRFYLILLNCRAKAIAGSGSVRIRVPESMIEDVRLDLEKRRPVGIRYIYEPIRWWECRFSRVNVLDGTGKWI